MGPRLCRLAIMGRAPGGHVGVLVASHGGFPS